ncbi:unnamed protein product [Amoebophrya sp. A120]|nr:unnamed protein product [Amoebophrya sp. A120]|eukprot:GSA120T00016612001.1
MLRLTARRLNANNRSASTSSSSNLLRQTSANITTRVHRANALLSSKLEQIVRGHEQTHRLRDAFQRQYAALTGSAAEKVHNSATVEQAPTLQCAKEAAAASQKTEHQNEQKSSSGSNKTAAASVSVLLGGVFVGNYLLFDEMDADEPVPAFDPKKTRYDVSTYWGRVKLMRDMTDPSSLLCTEEELVAYQNLLKSWSARKKYSEEENLKFWEAKKVVDATIHPVTGEVMFLPGRMSAYVPANLPVTSGMVILSQRSLGQTVFWQWLNQTINVACNYVNRSGAAIDDNKLLFSYVLACSSAVGIAVGLNRLSKSVVLLQRLGLLTPYLAVCAANAANMISTRMEEWQTGVPVFDQDGRRLGISAKAGWEGVWQTLVNRGWITPLPFLAVPPVVLAGLRPFIPAGPMMIATEIAVVGAAMYYSLPFTLALSQQTLELDPKSLEPEFHNLKLKNGQPVEKIFCNKGL